jgi:hypothetical protein
MADHDGHDLIAQGIQARHILGNDAAVTGDAYLAHGIADLGSGHGILLIGMMPQQLQQLQKLDLSVVVQCHKTASMQN